jgi:hypothetical protein
MSRVTRTLAIAVLATGIAATPLAAAPASAGTTGVGDKLVTVVVKNNLNGNIVNVSPNVGFPVAITACNNNINVGVLTAIDQGNKGPTKCWTNAVLNQSTWVQQN